MAGGYDGERLHQAKGFIENRTDRNRRDSYPVGKGRPGVRRWSPGRSFGFKYEHGTDFPANLRNVTGDEQWQQ